MKPFSDRLIDAIKSKNSRVVVGLDPRIENLPPDLQRGAKSDVERAAQSILEWGGEIIDAVRDHAVAVKPQIAFYERLGPFGIVTYYALCRHAHKKGLLVIGDVKRGDVPDTARAYAEAHLDTFSCDAITVNPYLGSDSMAPFLEEAKKRDGGLFVLVKTSNPGSGDFQDRLIDGRPLYLHVADRVAQWGSDLMGKYGWSSVGAVVGATHPEEAVRVREALPTAFFLVPGYGAQGATVSDLKAGFGREGLGAICNASRSVIFAYEKEPWKSKFPGDQWAKAVAAAAEAMKKEINAVL
ncbi:MAG TPA: orotidine-5'-phosphate decarboxylase [Planctomycetota bacterium]|nr:orotidine-5'-phosphate decarboxylase [Planctomycetota bacterium]